MQRVLLSIILGISLILFPGVSAAAEAKASYSECAAKFGVLPIAGELRMIWGEAFSTGDAKPPDANAYSEPWQQDILKDASWIYQADHDSKMLFDKIEPRIKYLFDVLKSNELKSALNSLDAEVKGAPAYLIANYAPDSPDGIEILVLVLHDFGMKQMPRFHRLDGGVFSQIPPSTAEEISELGWLLAIPLNSPCGRENDILFFALGMGFENLVVVTTDLLRRESLPIFLAKAKPILEAVDPRLVKFSDYRDLFKEAVDKLRDCCTLDGDSFIKEWNDLVDELITKKIPTTELVMVTLMRLAIRYEGLIKIGGELFEGWSNNALRAQHPSLGEGASLDKWDAIPIVYYDLPSGLFAPLVVFYGAYGEKGYLFDPAEGKVVEGDTMDKRGADGNRSLFGKYMDETHKNGYLIYRLPSPPSPSYLSRAGNRILSWFTSPAPPPGQREEVIEMMKTTKKEMARETIEWMGGEKHVKSVADWFNYSAAALGLTSGGLVISVVGAPAGAVGGLVSAALGLTGQAIENELESARTGQASPVNVATTVLIAASAPAALGAIEAAVAAASPATNSVKNAAGRVMEYVKSLPSQEELTMRHAAWRAWDRLPRAEKDRLIEKELYEEALRFRREYAQAMEKKWAEELAKVDAIEREAEIKFAELLEEMAKKGGGGSAAGGIIGASGGIGTGGAYGPGEGYGPGVGGGGPGGGFGEGPFTGDAGRKAGALDEWAKAGQGGPGGSGSLLDYGKDKGPGERGTGDCGTGGAGACAGGGKYSAGSGGDSGRGGGKGSGSGSGSGGSGGKDWWSGGRGGGSGGDSAQRPSKGGGSGGGTSGGDTKKEDNQEKPPGGGVPDDTNKDKGYKDYDTEYGAGIGKEVNCAESDDRPGCVGTGSRGSAVSAADAAATALRQETCAKVCSGNPDPECLSKCTGGGPTPGPYGEGVEIGFSGGQPKDGGVVCNCPEGATDCNCAGGGAAGSGLGAQTIQAKIAALCTPRPDGTGCEQRGEGEKTQASPASPGLGPQPKPVGAQQGMTQQSMKTESTMTKAFNWLNGFFKGLLGN